LTHSKVKKMEKFNNSKLRLENNDPYLTKLYVGINNTNMYLGYPSYIFNLLASNKTVTHLVIEWCITAFNDNEEVGLLIVRTFVTMLQINTSITLLDIIGLPFYSNVEQLMFSGLAANKTIKKLFLRHLAKSPSDDFLRNLVSKNSIIEEFCLSGNYLKTPLFCQFSQCITNVTQLKIIDATFHASNICEIGKALASNASISHLTISHSNLETKSLIELINPLPSSMTQMIADGLRTNTTLVYLDLSQIRLDWRSGQIIGDALAHNSTLTTLNLSCNRIPFSCLEHGLRRNTSLSTLIVARNEDFVHSLWLDTIPSVIRYNTSLHTLDLSENNLGDYHGLPILTSLISNTNITDLSLSNNKLARNCTPVITKILRKNTTLTTLDVSDNYLYDGELKITNALRTNTTLTSLNISYNGFDVDCPLPFIEALRHNTTLSALNIFGISFFSEKEDEIVEILQTNTTLRELYIDLHNIHSEEKIVEILTANTRLTELHVKGVHENVCSRPDFLQFFTNNYTLQRFKAQLHRSQYKPHKTPIKGILLRNRFLAESRRRYENASLASLLLPLLYTKNDIDESSLIQPQLCIENITEESPSQRSSRKRLECSSSSSSSSFDPDPKRQC